MATYAQYEENRRTERSQALITEEPLSIRVAGSPYSVVMRTPGDENAHVAGFCLAEGLVDHPDDIVTISFCTEDQTNVATLTLTEERRIQAAGLLERKGFVSQTSCGICGKEVIEDIARVLVPVKSATVFSVSRIMAGVDQLPDHQPLYRSSRSSHAAVIFSHSMEAMAAAEDVGRHNALDKAIGKVFMLNQMKNACLAIMSSRLSYELVQKAGRAGLEMLVGISRPTALAVDLARSVNMTLACAKDGRLMVFCGDHRIGHAESREFPAENPR
ncbi:MAG: formate dehydrogenase accessory sulfurtransferase FdhD [Desulfobacterales bacterium]|nr:formate dehydrogenase accessory sulfurtransferase FdhD [Desulfobacterales bacterium]